MWVFLEVKLFDPDLGVKIFFCVKEGAAEKERVDFEIGNYSTCCTLVLMIEENFMQNLFGFSLF